MSPLVSWLAPDHMRRALGDLIQNVEGPGGGEPMRIVRLEVPAPFYIDFMTDERGAVVDTRVVFLIEHLVVVEG